MSSISVQAESCHVEALPLKIATTTTATQAPASEHAIILYQNDCFTTSIHHGFVQLPASSNASLLPYSRFLDGGKPFHLAFTHDDRDIPGPTVPQDFELRV